MPGPHSLAHTIGCSPPPRAPTKSRNFSADFNNGGIPIESVPRKGWATPGRSTPPPELPKNEKLDRMISKKIQQLERLYNTPNKLEAKVGGRLLKGWSHVSGVKHDIALQEDSSPNTQTPKQAHDEQKRPPALTGFVPNDVKTDSSPSGSTPGASTSPTGNGSPTGHADDTNAYDDYCRAFSHHSPTASSPASPTNLSAAQGPPMDYGAHYTRYTKHRTPKTHNLNDGFRHQRHHEKLSPSLPTDPSLLLVSTGNLCISNVQIPSASPPTSHKKGDLDIPPLTYSQTPKRLKNYGSSNSRVAAESPQHPGCQLNPFPMCFSSSAHAFGSRNWTLGSAIVYFISMAYNTLHLEPKCSQK